MRRVFSYVLFLVGLFVLVLSILTIFFKITPVDTALAEGMAAFGLILCLVGVFIAAAGAGAN
jgi:hypothetical protein